MSDNTSEADTGEKKNETETVFGEREKRAARNIEVDSLFLGELNERLDPGDIEGLARSIEQVGVLEPLLVRPVGDRFEVVAGGRRLRAAVRAKTRAVPCIVKTMDDVSALKASFHENQERKSASPLEYGLLCWKMAQRCENLREVADQLGKTQAWVESRINAYELYKKADVIPTDRGTVRPFQTDKFPGRTLGLVDANEIMQAVTSPPIRRQIAKTEGDPESVRTRLVRELSEEYPKLSPPQKKRLLRELRKQPSTPVKHLVERILAEPAGIKLSLSFTGEVTRQILEETDRTGERPEAWIRRIVLEHLRAARNGASVSATGVAATGGPRP